MMHLFIDVASHICIFSAHDVATLSMATWYQGLIAFPPNELSTFKQTQMSYNLLYLL